MHSGFVTSKCTCVYRLLSFSADVLISSNQIADRAQTVDLLKLEYYAAQH